MIVKDYSYYKEKVTRIKKYARKVKADKLRPDCTACYGSGYTYEKDYKYTCWKCKGSGKDKIPQDVYDLLRIIRSE